MRAFFWYFIIVKICGFFIIRFYLIMLLTFFQISLNFSKKISSFIKKDTFNFITISSICTHFWKEYAQRSNLFSIITANKIFKILFTKRDLIRYYCFTNIYIVYRNRTSILVKFIFFNFSIIKLFYSFLFMVLKFSHNFLNL